MNLAASTLDGLRALDQMARMDSPVHRLHPLVSVLVALAFVATVASFPPHEVSGLLPFLVVPLAGAVIAGIPAGLFAVHLLRAAPFALALAAPALFFDRTPLPGPLPVTGGMITFASVALRVILTVSATTVLAATTGIEGVAWSLGRIGLPRSVGVQVVLLYRHLFVLAGEGARMVTARDLRAFGRGRDPATWGALVGSLLLRALARGQRVSGAMALRGFDGQIRPLRVRPLRPGDAILLAAFVTTFLVLRLVHLPTVFGTWILEMSA